MTIIVLTHGHVVPLLERLAAVPGVTIGGVFIETELVRQRSLGDKLRRSIRYDGYTATALKFGRLAGTLISSMVGTAIGALVRRIPGGLVRRPARFARRSRPAETGATNLPDAALDACARRHGIPVHRVPRYDDPAALALMAAAAPDLGIAWGTGILPPSVFGLPRRGTLNLHQGHTPYYRGGPSVFWELFNGESQVGLTIHFVATAVDAGDVVLQELVPLAYDYERFGTQFERFLDDCRARLRERGADLLVEAVRRVADGTAVRQTQDVSLGRRYKLPTRTEQDELRRRLRARYAPGRTPSLRGASVGPS